MNSRIKKLKESLNHTIINEFKVLKTFKQFNYKPRTYEDFLKVLEEKAANKDPNLNDIDVSKIKKIGGFSTYNFFNFNPFFVDEWDTSDIVDFSYCFNYCSEFDGDLSNWDTSNAINMVGFFEWAVKFNQPIDNFKIENVKSIFRFLNNAKKFNRPLDNFKFSIKVGVLSEFFEGCLMFNQDISMWDVSNVGSFSYMFRKTYSFKQDLSRWDVSSAVLWEDVFKDSLMEKYPELMPEKFRKDYSKK